MSKISGNLINLTCILWLSLGFSLCPDQGMAHTIPGDLPRAARVALAKAGKLINSKDYDQAIALLTSFQAKGPAAASKGGDTKGYHHTEIYFTLGTCYLLQNDYPKAAIQLERAVQQDFNHLSAWLNLAKVNYELQDYQRAAECFTKAYDLSEDKNPEFLYHSAVAYLLSKQYEPSIAIFERLIEDHPEKFKPAWRENLVHALLSVDQSLRALPHIQHLAEEYRGEKQIQWQEILLQQYMQLDMSKKALAYATFLAKQAPTQAKWWKALVSINLQRGKYQSALTALLIDGYLEPLSEQELKLVADLYLQLGVPSKAVPLYQEVLAEKNTPQLLKSLVLSLRQLGQAEQALTALNKFVQNNKDPEMQMQKADLLYELGRYQAAADLYSQTAKKSSRQKDRALQMAKYAMLQVNYMDESGERKEQTITF